MRDLCGPMRTYADLCGPMRAYLARKGWTFATKDIPFKCLSRRGACPPGGAAAPSAATAVTVSASMRPAIAHSQAMEEQLRPLAHKGGQCAPESDPLESHRLFGTIWGQRKRTK